MELCSRRVHASRVSAFSSQLNGAKPLKALRALSAARQTLAPTVFSAKHNDPEKFSIAPFLATGICLASAFHPAVAEAASASVATAGDTSFLQSILSDPQLRDGFVSGLTLISFSELGDKTFFIALLLASRHSKSAVFTGTFGALAVMTVISVALGQAFHQLDELLPATATRIPFDDLIAAGLLAWFGIRTLQEANDAREKQDEEKEEAQEVVEGFTSNGDLAFILSTFALVFAAEWGDKSFLATIALSAASSPAGVVFGASAGHALATGIAVGGGSLISNFVDEVKLQYIGGSMFLVFAAVTLAELLQKI